MSRFDPPYRRFAIRAKKRGEESWLTDDGQGCDDSCDFTGWDAKRLVTYVDRDEAQSHAERMREYAHNRGFRLRVMSVWEYPGGVYERKRRPKD